MIWWILAAAVIGLSVWGWRHTSSTIDFFAASRTAGPLLAGLGGTAAGLSAFVFVGGPGLFAAIGAASLWIVLSAPLTGALQCWAVGERVVELVRQNRCFTVPDLVAVRFGNGWPRALSAAAIVVGGIATLAVQIKATAVVGAVLTDYPGWLVAVAAVAATVAYTAAGGMRAGILAEAVQGAIMGVTALALAAFALARAGGPSAAVHTVIDTRPELLQVWGDRGAGAGIGLFLLFAVGTCAQPHYLQKFLLVRDRRSLRLLPAVMTVALLAVLTVWVGVGLGGTALWLQGRLSIDTADQLAPSFLRTALPGPLMIAAVVAVLAAVMSTAASLLNLIAAAAAHDIPIALGRREPSTLTPARLATAAAAAAAAMLGLLFDRPLAWLGVIGWGSFTATLLPTVVIGLNWPGATRRGVIVAMALGGTVQLGLELARPWLGVGAAWEPGLTGAALGTVAMILFSSRQTEHRRESG